MLANRTRRLTRLAGAAAFLPILMLSLMLGAGTASAGRSICRTDPIITFSDGTVVQLVATLQTDASLVSSVNYVLHVPSSMQVSSIDYWDADPVLENVTVFNDMPVGKFSGSATALLLPGTPKVPWSVAATINNFAGATFSGDTSKPLTYSYGGAPLPK